MSSRCALPLVIALAIGCHRGPKPPDGDVAASLTAPPVGEHAFDPATIKGKPALVMFMTPTCPHCIKTLPIAAAAARAEDANAVAVFVAGKAENATGVIAHASFTGPALVDDGALLEKYNITAVPTIFVLGPDGHARDVYIGEQDESTLRGALADAR